MYNHGINLSKQIIPTPASGFARLGGSIPITKAESESKFSTGRFVNFVPGRKFTTKIFVPLTLPSTSIGIHYLEILQNIEGKWSFIGTSQADCAPECYLHFQLEEDALMFKMSI